MVPSWKTVHRFDVPEPPEYLAITAWGRQFRVVPTRPLRPGLGVPIDIVRVEIVGRIDVPSRQPPKPENVIHVDVLDDLTDDVAEVPEPADVVDLVYELATQAHDDITAVSTPGTPSDGGCFGT
jgi:hypothetical protein